MAPNMDIQASTFGTTEIESSPVEVENNDALPLPWTLTSRTLESLRTVSPEGYDEN